MAATTNEFENLRVVIIISTRVISQLLQILLHGHNTQIWEGENLQLNDKKVETTK